MPRAGGRKTASAGWVTGAGGVIVQGMPGLADGSADGVVGRVQSNLESLGSVSLLVRDGATPEELANAAFKGIQEIKILAEMPVRFACKCSRDRAASTLSSLGGKDLRQLASEQEKAEVRCHFCNEVYVFTNEELREIAEGVPRLPQMVDSSQVFLCSTYRTPAP